jgi:hypothetical protein
LNWIETVQNIAKVLLHNNAAMSCGPARSTRMALARPRSKPHGDQCAPDVPLGMHGARPMAVIEATTSLIALKA